MPPLDNPKRELFCQLVAMGGSYLNAHSQVYGPGTKATNGGGSRLMMNKSVRARVAELQDESARETILTLQATHRLLLDIVRSRPCDIDETNPLCQATRRGDITEYKLPDKLRAAGLAMKLQGFLRETPEKKPASLPANYTGAILPLSLLHSIQAERRRMLDAQAAEREAAEAATDAHTAP